VYLCRNRREGTGLCRNRREGTGLCHADPIPADLIEGHVLDHLEAFVGDAGPRLDPMEAAIRRALDRELTQPQT